MRYLLFLVLLASCALSKPKDEDNLVSVDTALRQAQSSYLRGCVEAMKELGVPVAFPGCRDKARLHFKELESMMKSEIIEISGDKL